MEISSLLNLHSSGVQKRHAEMLESEGTSRMRAQVPFLPPKGGMVSINPFRHIPNQCENTIDSSAHCYHRQQLRCKNLSVMAARIEQLFNWRVRYSMYRAFPPHPKQLRSQTPLRNAIRQKSAQDVHKWIGFGIENLIFNSPLTSPSAIPLLRLRRSEIDAPGWVWGFLDST